MPRVLNMYSTAPLWRAYFETLGVPPRNIVFSDFTSEEMWEAGGRYGSIDPCFPSKVAQAHIHDLLFVKHKARPLDFIFFPCLTHLPSFVTGMPDTTACPIVAGAPKVMRAAFTKECDYFAREGVAFVDPAISLNEPNYMKQQMFEAWGERLRVTRDESDFALDQGWMAMRCFDSEMQRRGMLLLGTARGGGQGRHPRARPAVPRRPRAQPWCARRVPGARLSGSLDPLDPEGSAMARRASSSGDGQGADILGVADVWPEAYSTNSAEKVWAAKFAARHPNLVVLDFSSFKCGHDAPTYGMIDNIVAASATPYSALHDIDANKPSGSIRIRVRTYAHALQRHAEKLEDLRAAKDELARRIDARRRELRALRQGERAAGNDPLDEAYAAYLGEEKPIRFAPTRAEDGARVREHREGASDHDPPQASGRGAGCDGAAEAGMNGSSDHAPRTVIWLRDELARGERIERELRQFEREERMRLGLAEAPPVHWRDPAPQRFTREERAHTTLLCGGLTQAQDLLIQGALRGIGYRVQVLDTPGQRGAALR